MEYQTPELPYNEVKQETNIEYQRVETSNNNYSLIRKRGDGLQTNPYSLADCWHNQSNGFEYGEVIETRSNKDTYQDGEYFVTHENNDPGQDQHFARQAEHSWKPQYMYEHAAGDLFENKIAPEGILAPAQQFNDQIHEQSWADDNDLDPSHIDECKERTKDVNREAYVPSNMQHSEDLKPCITESDGNTRNWNEPKDYVVEEERNCNLTYCLRDLLKHRVEFQYPSEEILDILESVQKLVEYIVNKVTSKVAWLPVSNLVRVGSIEEETSILKPDEFDYIAVIEPQGVQVERVCDDRKGHAHVTITDPKQSALWRKWFHDGWLKGSFTSGFLDYVRYGVAMFAPGAIKTAVNNIIPSVLNGYFDTLGDAFMSEVDSVLRETSVDELTFKYNSGKLYADKGLRKHGPGFMLTFVWMSKNRNENLNIMVDITPAIKLDIPDGFIAEDETFHKTLWDKLQQHGKIMLIQDHDSDICKKGICFRITFTESEVLLIKDLTKHHKEVYKLLKYILKGGEWGECLTSYVLKTLVVKHNCYCSERENLAICFKKIVAACLHYMFNRKTKEKMEISRIFRLPMPGQKFKLFVPSMFIKDHNIRHTKDYVITCEVFLAEIESILESLEEVSRTSSSDFENIKVFNSHTTALHGYLKAIGHLELKNCYIYLEKYFDDRIL